VTTALKLALDQRRAARTATLAAVADVGEQQANRRPEGGGWSIAQVLDHLIKTDEVCLGFVRRLFELRAAGREPVAEISLSELNTRPPFVPGALLPYMDRPFRLMNRMVPSALREYLTGTAVIPFHSPDAAAPAPQGAIDELRRRARASLDAWASQLEGRDVSGMIVDHPLLGRNDVPALLRVLARHEERHHGQISRLVAKRSDARVPAAPLPKSEDPELRAFAEHAEAALVAGRQILSWWRTKALMDSLKLFPLGGAKGPEAEVQGFFDEILFLGQMKPTSIMGCLQRHRFQRRRTPTPDTTPHLESFIDEWFLEKSCRVRDDGSPGGFRYAAVCYKGKDDCLESPSQGERLALKQLRNGRKWGVLQVDLLDFVRAQPMLAPYDKLLSRFIKQSAYIVIHEDLAAETTKAPKGVMADRRFGYAFLPRSVAPNYFGFGPGKFGAAIKQWRFLLFLNGDIEVQVAFLVAPRSEKVLDIGGFDPFYTAIGLADAFTLGSLGLGAAGHEALDRAFLQHHADVHADVVTNFAHVWESQRWTPSFGSW
jgi:uncharacterized damage-inducible protein DinB